MQISKLWVILFILCFGTQTLAEVTMYHGVIFYGSNLEVTFLDDTRLIYFEIGDTYVNLSYQNITDNGLVGYFNTINVSYVNNSVWNQSRGWRLIEFNGTHTNIDTIEWMIDFNSSNFVIDYYLDNVLTRDDILQYQTQDYYSFNWTNDGTSHRHEWVLDGYSPDPPYKGRSNVTIDIATPNVNLTWLRGNYSDREVAVYKSTGYPATPWDGTEAYNGTHLDYNFTVNQTAYFSIWSYNSTTNRYSRSGLQIPWGLMGMQTRNESKPWQNITFGITISNSDGSDTYQRYWGATSPFYINLSKVPYGENTILLVNSTGFKDRVLYMDLRLNEYYNLTFYLPPIITEVDDGGGDTGDIDDHNLSSHLYYLQVLNEHGQPVGDANVDVQRYFNTTDSYESVAILLTDSNGMNSVSLVPNELYRIIVTANGYDIEYADWIPDPDYYGIYYPKLFTLSYSKSSENITSFTDIIFFNASMLTNNTIHIFYQDATESTTDVTFYIFEEWNGTRTQLTSKTFTNNDDLDCWFTVTNTSRRHSIRLHLNHSILGYEVVYIYVNPLHTPADEEDIETTFESALGYFNLGWVKTFLIFLPCLVIMVLFGRNHIGIAIMGTGLYLGFTAFFISVESAITYGVLAGIFIVMGVVVTIVKKGSSTV